MKNNKLRDAITATGSFVSLPEAFPGADEAVKLAPKIELCVARFEDSKRPLEIDILMRPHTLLVDLEAVNAGGFDVEKLVRDCDALKEVALAHPEKLRGILAAFAADAPHEKMLDAAKVAEELGLSEEVMTKKGGGLLWLLVIVAAVALSGCKGCAHGKGNYYQ
jgi:hypothetical protein